MARRRRYTPEQIIRKLREAERLQAQGTTIPEVAKQLEISEQTHHRWRNQFGGMKAGYVVNRKKDSAAVARGSLRVSTHRRSGSGWHVDLSIRHHRRRAVVQDPQPSG